MKKRRTAYQRNRRGEWHPAVEWLRVPLIVVAVLLTLPVTMPVAMIQHGRIERRRRQRADKTPCTRCGAVLGEAALARADAEWTAHVDKLHREHPHVMFRLVRKVWAVCAVCGQKHGYDERKDEFVQPTCLDEAKPFSA